MGRDNYYKIFDARTPGLTGTIIISKLAIIQDTKRESIEPKYSQEVKELSEMFYNLSKDYNLDTYCRNQSTENVLERFYWPSNDFPENLRGKTTEDVRLHSWLFAKNLETFKKDSPGEKQKLIEDLNTLFWLVIPEIS